MKLLVSGSNSNTVPVRALRGKSVGSSLLRSVGLNSWRATAWSTPSVMRGKNRVSDLPVGGGILADGPDGGEEGEGVVAGEVLTVSSWEELEVDLGDSAYIIVELSNPSGVYSAGWRP